MDKHRVPAGRYVAGNLRIHPAGGILTNLGEGFEISWPVADKNSVRFQPQTPSLVFGNPIHGPVGDTPVDESVEFTRDQIAEMYRYVRENVAPLFERFFIDTAST